MKKTAGKNFQAGDIFIGTTNGLYHWYKRENKNNFKKIPDLDYKINEIILNNNGNVKAENVKEYTAGFINFGS